MDFSCDFTECDYPVAQCVSLIDFAARGVGHRGVAVWLRPTQKVKGREQLPFSGVAINDREVRLRLGPQRILPAYIMFVGWGELSERFPHGVPSDGWRDMLVFLAAHEFRHIWQHRQYGKLVYRTRHRVEEDANEHGLKMLNRYRLLTGRDELEVWP